MLWKLVLVAALVAGAFALIQRDAIEKEAKAGIAIACKQVNAESSTTQAQQAITDFRWCLERLIDVDNMMAEIAAAQPTGDLDVVFKKYCARTGQLKACLDSLSAGVEPCVPATFRHFVPVLTNATINFLDFFCFNNGDRIALFVAEDGPECYRSRLKEMQSCFASEIRLPNLINSNLVQRCTLYDQWSECVVKVMEQCKSKTPSNMVDSMFKSIRKQTACHTVKQKNRSISRYNWRNSR